MFTYRRRVAFVDTDAMGVTHHVNYLRYCEEARVAWMREHGLTHTHFPKSDHVLAVLETRVRHLRASTFDDELEVRLQVRREGLKIHFQYALARDGERVAEAETIHIPVDAELKPRRPDRDLIQHLEKEKWTETWLSNS